MFPPAPELRGESLPELLPVDPWDEDAPLGRGPTEDAPELEDV
jgi:hypothetical protein